MVSVRSVAQTSPIRSVFMALNLRAPRKGYVISQILKLTIGALNYDKYAIK